MEKELGAGEGGTVGGGESPRQRNAPGILRVDAPISRSRIFVQVSIYFINSNYSIVNLLEFIRLFYGAICCKCLSNIGTET
jgi:hypothetical protein